MKVTVFILIFLQWKLPFTTFRKKTFLCFFYEWVAHKNRLQALYLHFTWGTCQKLLSEFFPLRGYLISLSLASSDKTQYMIYDNVSNIQIIEYLSQRQLIYLTSTDITQYMIYDIISNIQYMIYDIVSNMHWISQPVPLKSLSHSKRKKTWQMVAVDAEKQETWMVFQIYFQLINYFLSLSALNTPDPQIMSSEGSFMTSSLTLKGSNVAYLAAQL